MQRNDLVPQDIVARLQGGWDLGDPGDVVREECVSGPGARVRAAKPATCVEFNERKGRFVNGGTFAVARGYVVNDGAFVGSGPGVPLESDGVAGFDSDVGLAGGGGFVADDVAG